MKLTILFLCALGVLATSAKEKSLGEELKDFRALIPFKNIRSLIFAYNSNDKEFQELVNYFLSDNVLPGIEEIERIPEINAIIEYLHEHDSDIYQILNRVHEILGLKPYHGNGLYLRTGGFGGLKGFIETLRTLIPAEKLKALYEEKLKTSKVFQEFVDFLKSSSSQAGFEKVRQNQYFQNLMKFFKAKNVDFTVVTDFIAALTGIKIKPIEQFYSNKHKLDCTKDVLEFVDLLPSRESLDIGNQYLKGSDDFRLAYLYINSKLFERSAKALWRTTESNELDRYLNGLCLNVKKYFKAIVSQSKFQKLNLKDAKPDQEAKTGSLSDYVEDLKSLLPTEKINQLKNEKLEVSPGFRNLTRALQSAEIFELYRKLGQTLEAEILAEEAEAFGVDLRVLAKFVYSLIGLEFEVVAEPEPVPEPATEPGTEPVTEPETVPESKLWFSM